jgi:hypothetical protein
MPGWSALVTPPILCPQAIKPIMSADENPILLKLLVNVFMSSEGTGVPVFPAVHASIRPPRNGMVGPWQVATEKIAPRAIRSAPINAVRKTESQASLVTDERHICWEMIRSLKDSD